MAPLLRGERGSMARISMYTSQNSTLAFGMLWADFLSAGEQRQVQLAGVGAPWYLNGSPDIQHAFIFSTGKGGLQNCTFHTATSKGKGKKSCVSPKKLDQGLSSHCHKEMGRNRKAKSHRNFLQHAATIPSPCHLGYMGRFC